MVFGSELPRSGQPGLENAGDLTATHHVGHCIGPQTGKTTLFWISEQFLHFLFPTSRMRVTRFYQAFSFLLPSSSSSVSSGSLLGSQLQAANLSGHFRTSTASSRPQWALPDSNCKLQISVGTAHLNCELQISVGTAGTIWRGNHWGQILLDEIRLVRARCLGQEYIASPTASARSQ